MGWNMTVHVLKWRLVYRKRATQVEDLFKMVGGEVQMRLVAMADLGVGEEVRPPRGGGVDTQGEAYSFHLVLGGHGGGGGLFASFIGWIASTRNSHGHGYVLFQLIL